MNIEDHITKKSDLQNNESLSSFMNHCAQQSHFAYQVFYDFLAEIRPDRILEIGTALGGFTQFLNICKKELNLDTYILSYDIHSRDWYDDMIKQGIDVRVENIFFDNFSGCKQEVIDFINKSGTTVVLCDGGYKIGEFNLLSRYIKVGDYILAHDYSTDKEYFEKNINSKIWNWMEIQESDISNACVSNNLIDHNKEKFNQAAWVCKKKVK
jgi:cephalosporin hydroxylase